ncbi:MAG: Mpo1-like protein [Gammaproteobacteria bacterium]
MSKRYQSFGEFYPFYLSQHSDPTCRRLHYVGTALVLTTVVYALVTGRWRALWLAPVFGYGFAWVGHFFFERNRPATFSYPLYSLIGDFRLFFDRVAGRHTH